MRPTTEALAQFRAMPQKGLNFGVIKIDMEKIEATIKAFTELEAGAAKLRADIAACNSTLPEQQA
jgi:hypothetical protein